MPARNGKVGPSCGEGLIVAGWHAQWEISMRHAQRNAVLAVRRHLRGCHHPSHAGLIVMTLARRRLLWSGLACGRKAL